MRFTRAARSRFAEAVMDITPLVDVVFLLIIFLLLTTTFKKREYAFSLDLPTASEKEVLVRTEHNTVYVTQEGKFYYLQVEADDAAPETTDDALPAGVAPTDEKGLEARLRALVEKDPDVELSIKAQNETAYQHVVDVLNVARRAGLQRVILPYEFKGEEGKDAAKEGAVTPADGP